MIGIGSFAGVTIGSTGALPSADAARTAGLQAKVTDAIIGTDHKLGIRLTCQDAGPCQGTVRLVAVGAKGATNARIKTPWRTVRVAKRAAKPLTIKLSKAQVKRLTKAGKARVALQIRGDWGTRRVSATLRPATTAISVRTTRATVSPANTVR